MKNQWSSALVSPESADLVDAARLRNYAGFAWRATRRRWRLALAAFLGVMALALAADLVLPQRWQVQATVLAQRGSLISTLSNPGMNREWDAPTRAARDLVLRQDNLVALVRQTDLLERQLAARAPAVKARDSLAALLGGDRTREQRTEALVDTLRERLWVTASGEGTVSLTLSWTDRQLAYDLLQAVVQGFLEERYLTESRMVNETIAILEGHDDKVQRQIATTIAQLEQKEKALRLNGAPRLGPALRARSAGDEDLVRLESTLAGRRRALTDLEDFRQRRLVELQSQLAQQLTVYAPQHPAVQGTRHAIDAAGQASPQLEALRLEVQELGRQVSQRGGRGDALGTGAATLQAELAEAARLRLQLDDPRLEVERRQLDLLLRQHAQLTERLDAARVELDTAQAAFKYRYAVLTPPQLPRGPVRPYLLLYLLGGLAGGSALAVFLAAWSELRSGVLEERWQVEEVLEVPVVSELHR